ncbi:MAG TPA: hypothetical protein VGQ65_14660 [Thermoanaerobaculia bacterium]|nr:hypothetical protein [Thermoanaerobaculia bacterium]
MSRRTPSRARPKNAEVPDAVDAAAVATTGPQLNIAAEFEPPAPAAELPPFEHRPRRRATK